MSQIVKLFHNLNKSLFWLTYISFLLSVVPLFVICKAVTKMTWTQLISSSWRRYKKQDPQFPKVGTSNLWASETAQADWILVQSFMFNIIVSKNPVLAWVPSRFWKGDVPKRISNFSNHKSSLCFTPCLLHVLILSWLQHPFY